jgi:ElaB/YqjD/DUF883 family membrane-anchored ribosome-binding protein
MDVTRKLVSSLLLLALLCTEACNKKKPPLPLQAQAPTIAETLPEEIPESTELPPPDVAQLPAPPAPAKKPAKKTAKATTKKSTPPATATVAATPPPAPASAQTPPPSTQTVASLRAPHSNSAPDPAPEMSVAAAIPSDKANKQREDTAHMVDSTESALKSITRPLNDDEKSMRTQIETFLQQSRKATADGDYERAFNLAKKAQVLVGALIKP